MERATDILAYLGAVVEKHAQHYKTDFDSDKQMLLKAALKPNAEDRTFYFMCRPSGTWCFWERDVFIRDSEANITWQFYADEAKSIRTFRVLITGFNDGGETLIGDIQPFNYASQVERVKQSALPLVRVTGIYEDGTPFEAPRGNYSIADMYQHGGIKEKRYEPENELELSNLLAWEHRAQDRPAIRPRQKKQPTKQH